MASTIELRGSLVWLVLIQVVCWFWVVIWIAAAVSILPHTHPLGGWEEMYVLGFLLPIVLSVGMDFGPVLPFVCAGLAAIWAVAAVGLAGKKIWALTLVMLLTGMGSAQYLISGIAYRIVIFRLLSYLGAIALFLLWRCFYPQDGRKALK